MSDAVPLHGGDTMLAGTESNETQYMDAIIQIFVSASEAQFDASSSRQFPGRRSVQRPKRANSVAPDQEQVARFASCCARRRRACHRSRTDCRHGSACTARSTPDRITRNSGSPMERLDHYRPLGRVDQMASSSPSSHEQIPQGRSADRDHNDRGRCASQSWKETACDVD